MSAFRSWLVRICLTGLLALAIVPALAPWLSGLTNRIIDNPHATTQTVLVILVVAVIGYAVNAVNRCWQHQSIVVDAARYPSLATARLATPGDTEELDNITRIARARAADPDDEDEISRIAAELRNITSADTPDGETLHERAVHEAGHALVVITQGGTILEATLAASTIQWKSGQHSLSGHVTSADPLGISKCAVLWCQLVVKVAAAASERHYGYCRTAGSLDYQQSEEIAAALVAARFTPEGAADHPRTIREMITYAEHTAETIIAEHPQALAALIDALITAAGSGKALRHFDLEPLVDRATTPI